MTNNSFIIETPFIYLKFLKNSFADVKELFDKNFKDCTRMMLKEFWTDKNYDIVWHTKLINKKCYRFKYFDSHLMLEIVQIFNEV
ncbi:hypothetical protein HYD99_00880 [Mycoplasmopsis bovis]|nr:hypothetical protein HYD99_00880 [Mycoplasmopsis bovis]